VYEGGLKVYTTLDLDLQKAAESEIVGAFRRSSSANCVRKQAAGFR
jgi:membrane carboxypeptidase/penicillin-binding protein